MTKKVKVGLPYNSVLQTMRLEGGAGQYEGTAQADSNNATSTFSGYLVC